MRPPTAALVRAHLCTARTARLPLLHARIVPHTARLLPSFVPRQLSTAPPVPPRAASPASPTDPTDPYAGTETFFPLLSSTITTRILSSPSPTEQDVLSAFTALTSCAHIVRAGVVLCQTGQMFS